MAHITINLHHGEQTTIKHETTSIQLHLNNMLPSLVLLALKDRLYSSVLQIPPVGLDLKTRIYVEVKASNLTSRYFTLSHKCAQQTGRTRRHLVIQMGTKNRQLEKQTKYHQQMQIYRAVSP